MNIKLTKYLSPVLFGLLFSGCTLIPESETPLKIWFEQPTEEWNEGLPVGNGSLGGMIYGLPGKEQITLNEETIWTGEKIFDRDKKDGHKFLRQIQELLFDGEYVEAEKLAGEKLLAKRFPTGTITYQMLANLWIESPELDSVENYRRELDLNNALATTLFEKDGVKYRREYFSSHPDQAMVIRYTADKKGALNLSARIERTENTIIKLSNNSIHFSEHVGDGIGVKFYSIIDFETKGGEIQAENGKMVIEGASELIIRIVAASDYRGGEPQSMCEENLNNALASGYKEMLASHREDYRSLFKRVDFKLSQDDGEGLPTDVRLERVKEGAVDNYLTQLQYQFGRYLLISSSRPGNLPANLQGIWADGFSPPWNSDYHININIQMNYWLAEMTNLAECHEPFLKFICDLREMGRISARESYGCRGFVAHHTTDAWHQTAAFGNAGYGMWPMGAAWCCQHLYTHYEYTEDLDYLGEYAYPVMKEAAQFFVDFMVPDPVTGQLVSGPSISPENRFLDKNGERATMNMGPTMDRAIIFELFQNCIQASDILGIDVAFRDTLKHMVQQMPPLRIGSDGRLMEWVEEFEEAQPGHRHISHLYALHPSNQISSKLTPELFEAAKKTLEYRLSHGGGHTGWSRAWIVNFYARLLEAEKAHENIVALQAKSTLPNLLDVHPPFQIDGNFGVVSGITEMLMQSHTGEIHLLPALPEDWPSGHIKGIVARKGFELDIRWENGNLESLVARSKQGNTLQLRYGDGIINTETTVGQELHFNCEDFDSETISFSYTEIGGIGKDSLHNRRDNSDIIKVGDKYYVWYTRMDSPITPGYWGTIWYATSEDEGYTWNEQGMALGKGKDGAFDSHAVFTPNILAYEGRYYLYYTGVKPTPGNPRNEFEGNSTTDITAIGLAVADSPEGPFKRVENNPVLTISEDSADFDSFRIDDASLLVREDKIWLYYKGRSRIHGKQGPGLTRMGVAYAEKPEGPYEKHPGPILDKSHEVLIWSQDEGVASLASISKSINFAPDGLEFRMLHSNLDNIPRAPGLYRPEIQDGNRTGDLPGWGISMASKKGLAHLRRFEIKVGPHSACNSDKESDTKFKTYDGSWESLQEMPVPAWFDDGKIGIFIHWGPYSVIGYRKGDRGYAEHVPKIIYEDPEHYYPYLEQRWGARPPEFGYKDIIPEFKAENWDPEEWADLFAEAGARYVVFTAEHHDGWANWDSDITPWNAVQMGPRRDLVGDLGKSLRARGLKYAPSYHRERHTSFFTTKKYVVNAEPRPDILEEIRRVPEAELLYGPFGFSKEAVDEYVARWKEIQEKYQPDMMWIDDIPIFTRDGNNSQAIPKVFKPEIRYLYDQCRLMITDFMNNGAANGQAVYVNNKGKNRNWPDGVGCLEKDNLKLAVIGPKWQSCTTFGTSFGYLAAEEDPEYPYKKKSVEEVIHELVEVISRNGNFLINIGPRGDGTIPAWQVERLRTMGDWLKINGDAIYGSRYWKVNDQENEQLSFTSNGKKLYAIKRSRPEAPFVIEATEGWEKQQVKSVRLIGSDAVLTWEITDQGLLITPPEDLGKSMYAWSFEIATNEEQHHPNVIQKDASKALEGTKKVDLEGS